MLALEPAWRDWDRTWVTLRSPDVSYLLRGEQVAYGYGPTPRNVKNFFRNLRAAARILSRQDPAVIVSTGAGLALPFFILGKLQRRKLVYVESITRVEQLGLTGRLVYPLADSFFVQWAGLGSLRRAEFHGSVADGSLA
jgi:UDP-N-acetylglucosamine:LPS N-acetylglucosamine transferase